MAIDGTPLHDIRIEIHSIANGTTLATCYSNSVGNFAAYNVHPGTYELIAFDGVNETREQVMLDSGPASVTMRMPPRSGGAPQKGTISVTELKTPEKARHLTEKAHNALAKDHNEEAAKLLESALSIAPDYPDALTLRAAMKLASNQPEAAIEDLDHAVKSDPTFGPAYLALGAAFNAIGRYDDALRSLDRHSLYNPQSWQDAFEKSKAWLGKQEYAQALQQLNRAQALSGNLMTAPIHLLRGYALAGESHFDQATAELEAYLKAEPNGQWSGSARMALAKIKTAMSQKDAVPLPTTGLFTAAH